MLGWPDCHNQTSLLRTKRVAIVGTIGFGAEAVGDIFGHTVGQVRAVVGRGIIRRVKALQFTLKAE